MRSRRRRQRARWMRARFPGVSHRANTPGRDAHREMRGLIVPAEIRDMRWALTASKHRSLRQAAGVLNVCESTLSRRLGELEYRLGAELFERSASGTRLTAAGEEFIATVTHILAEVDTAFGRMKARGRGESGDLVVGICMALSVGNLRGTLAEFGRRHEGGMFIASMDHAFVSLRTLHRGISISF